jgi:hypothetical protein
VIVQPVSEPILPADGGAGDWQPLIQSSMKSRNGAKLAACPPIGRTIGMVSSAARYQILAELWYSVKSEQKTKNTLPLRLIEYCI